MGPSVSVSVVVPAFDEVENLARLVAEVRAALDGAGLSWELLVVDDGSGDGSPAALAALAAEEPRVRAIRLPVRQGQTRALAAGFEEAAGTFIATCDADLQCPPAAIPALLDLLERSGADLACGIRADRHDPPSRRVASALANGARRCLLAPGVRDLACPLRVFRAVALARVTALTPLFDGAHRWLPALFVLAGLRVVQHPVPHGPRVAGESKYTTRARLLPIARELGVVLRLAVRHSRAWRTAAVLGVFGLIAVPYLYGLGSWPLIEPDEPRNAEVAREMLSLGRWVTPHFNGLPYLDKPVLLFWMIAGVFRLAGVGEFAARLPVALAALAMIALTFALARALIGWPRALLTAAIVATTPLVLVFGRLVIFDMPLTALVTAALLCLVHARLDGRPWRWLPLAGIAMGLAILAKGPVGLAVPLLAWFVARGALPRRPGPPSRGAALLGVLAAAALVAPWVLLVEREQPGFLRYALLDETFLRFSSSPRFHRSGPLWFYAEELLWALGGWGVVLAATAPTLVRRWRAGGRDAMAIAFAVRAAAAILVFFTLCASKRPAYILPAMTPLGILVAVAIAAEPARVAATTMVTATVVAGVGLAALVLERTAGVAAVGHLAVLTPDVLVGAGAFLTAWGIGTALATRRWPAAAVVGLMLLGPGLGAALLGPLTEYAEGRSSRALAARIEPDAHVVCFKTFRTGLPFYLRRPVVLVTADRGSELTSNYIAAQWRQFASSAHMARASTLSSVLTRRTPVYVVASPFSVRELSEASPRRLVEEFSDGRSILLRSRS